MKKYILAFLFTIVSFHIGSAQPLPPGCECCEGLPEPARAQCLNECINDLEEDYCDTAVPINANILTLFTLAISFGTYTIYRNNKKRRFEN